MNVALPTLGITNPRVKVCGVTRVEEARHAVACGAAMIGLNFYPPSPRNLTLERGREIADAVRGAATVVGVFVDRPQAEVEEIDRAVGLDLVQLHGDESPREVAAYGARALQVFRTDGDLTAVALSEYPEAWGFLFDVRHPTLYGGSGVAWSYGALRQVMSDRSLLDREGTARPLLVAGGIHPGNAAQAASDSGAWGIDVCSGVESSPGVKDFSLLDRLFEEVG